MPTDPEPAAEPSVAGSGPAWLAKLLAAVPYLLPLYWIALFTGTHLPGGEGPPVAEYDKLAHFVGYAGLAFLVTLFLGRKTRVTLPLAATAVLVAVAFGIVDEATQPFVGRDTEFLDWVADLGGAVTGAAAAWFILRKRPAAPAASAASTPPADAPTSPQ